MADLADEALNAPGPYDEHMEVVEQDLLGEPSQQQPQQGDRGRGNGGRGNRIGRGRGRCDQPTSWVEVPRPAHYKVLDLRGNCSPASRMALRQEYPDGQSCRSDWHRWTGAPPKHTNLECSKQEWRRQMPAQPAAAGAIVPAAKKARVAVAEEGPQMLAGMIAALSRATQQSFNAVEGHYAVTYNLNVNTPKEP